MNKIFEKVFLLSVFLPSALFADVMDPAYSTHCMDFNSQFAFIGTPFGLSVYDKEEKHWLELDLWISEGKTVTEKEMPHGHAPHILSLLSDSSWVWAGVWERRGVFRVNLMNDEVELWRNSKQLVGGFTGDTQGITAPIFECPLPWNTIVSIKKDRKGNILFATLFGIAQYNNEGGWKTLPAYCPYAGFREESEIDACITSIAVDDSNGLWIGTSDFHYAYYELEGAPEEEDVNGGVIFFDGKSWRHFYAHNYNLQQEDSMHVKTPLLSNHVTCVETDGDDVWIGTQYGVNVYNQETNEWRSYDEKDCEILGDYITSIAIAPDFNWVASRNGIAKFDKKVNRWSISGRGILPFESIQSIAYDPCKQSIWAVTCLYAYKDVYVYRCMEDEWSIYSSRKRVALKDPEELINLGLFLRKRGVNKESKAVFEEFLVKYAKHEKSLQAKYELLLLDGLSEENVQDFQKKYPNSVYAINLDRDLAKHYMRKRRWKAALRQLDHFISRCESREDLFDAMYAMSQCYESIHEYEKQVAVLEEICLKYPEKLRAWDFDHKIGSIYENKIHDYRKAIEYYEAVLTRPRRGGPVDELILDIGECYEKLGEYEKAVSTYEKIQPGWKFKEAKGRIERLRKR